MGQTYVRYIGQTVKPHKSRWSFMAITNLIATHAFFHRNGRRLISIARHECVTGILRLINAYLLAFRGVRTFVGLGGRQHWWKCPCVLFLRIKIVVSLRRSCSVRTCNFYNYKLCQMLRSELLARLIPHARWIFSFWKFLNIHALLRSSRSNIRHLHTFGV